MTLLKLAVDNPVATSVGCLLVTLFGIIALNDLPIQLTPEIERPVIVITTNWGSTSPEEVESEIIEPQEKQLRGLPGMDEILSQASRGRGRITIQFDVNYDLNRALIEVINRLNQIRDYPDDADEPFLRTGGGRARPIAWFILKPNKENPKSIEIYRDFVEEVVQSRFERVSGVALSEVRGGHQYEVRITFDPYKAAGLGIELPRIVSLVGGNDDVSGGIADVGKRSYSLRYLGKLNPQQLGELILEWRDNKPIALRDIAEVEVRTIDKNNFVINNGEQSIAVNAYREAGVNVLKVMQGLRKAVADLEQGPLKNAGLNIKQVYDETIYIDSAIELLRNNLILGIILAVAILWWFLRKIRATLIVTLTIPLCLFISFLVMNATQRTMNVISLAGMAFAVGMVMDAAIIVLENIVRMRESGETPKQAALKGTIQVWPALLASTLTTIAIFLPIIYLKDQSGQLFSDLAIAISAAIATSLVVACLVIPTAMLSFTKKLELEDSHTKWWDKSASFIMCITRKPVIRWLWIVGLIMVSVGITITAFPETDYLPQGNRNLVFGRVVPPPGVNIRHIEKEMGEVIAKRMQPYIDGSKSPKVKHYFFVASSGSLFLGARAQTSNKENVDQLLVVVKDAISGFPDTYPIVRRASLFSGVGGGTEIDINIHGNDIDSLLRAARIGFAKIPTIFNGTRPSPSPGLELAEPELRMLPKDDRLIEAGWNRATMANITRLLGQGLHVGEYFDGEKKIDITARVQAWNTPEELSAIPLYTPNSGILPVNELVDLKRSAGPNVIRRLNRLRTVTLELRPPADMPLEIAIRKINEEVVPLMEKELSESSYIRISGSANKLNKLIKNFSNTFLLAVLILYLLISALFRSFLDSLLVIFALPFATVGGVLMLVLLKLPADLLSMLGFIILLGLVVNNAILLVHQARTAERSGKTRPDAVRESVRIRLRPILMSTLTSIFGMLPLLLISGAGTELYKGLAGVIVGGMTVSTVFTLILLPSLLQLGNRNSNKHEPIVT